MVVLTVEDYNKLYNQNLTGEPGEVYLYVTDDEGYEYDHIVLCGEEYKVGSILQSADKNIEMSNYVDYMVVVVDSLDTLKMLASNINKGSSMTYKYAYNLEGDDDVKEAYCDGLRDAINEAGVPHVSMVENIFTTRQEFIGIYASLFFIGIFIGLLFLIATVLIIYYKQITEGYQDRDRFMIMQNVGMSKGEVKKVIKNQILTVFFLPIVIAIVHICFAFKIIKDILYVLNFNNTGLFVLCTIITVIVFIVFYGLVYMLTANAYYKIVNEKI